MKDFLRPAFVLLGFLPGLLLAYLPMKQHLRPRPALFVPAAVACVVLLAVAGGALCGFLAVPLSWVLMVSVAASCLLYVHTLRVTRWKSVSVFLAVCGVFSCLCNVASALDLILRPALLSPGLSLRGAVFYLLLCCFFAALSSRPAAHAARELLEDDALAHTWYVFWILPLLFITLNFFLFPLYPQLLYQGRMLLGYTVISLALLFLLLLFYFMFYLMASGLNRNDRLRQENQFLSMQQARYSTLRSTISEIRQSRHDMRHHFSVLQSLAAQQQWDALERYLADVQDSIPAADLGLCENKAVDSVAGHYALLCRKQAIPFSFALDLPASLPIPDIDLCSVLANLLENALEASLRTAPARRQIKARAYLRSGSMILLTVENPFDGAVREKGGVFQSSKRRGEGVGIQSVRRIADKNGGYSRFSHDGGVFRADVLLRANPGV